MCPSNWTFFILYILADTNRSTLSDFLIIISENAYIRKFRI